MNNLSLNFSVERSYFFDIQTITDERGSLGVIEKSLDIPFIPQRTYFLYGLPSLAKRGGHAHKALEQILFCPSGSCRVSLEDMYGNKKSIFLDSPSKGLYVPNMLWRELDEFSENTVFVCCASQKYSENDYIRDKSEFKKINPNIND